jgi:transposase
MGKQASARTESGRKGSCWVLAFTIAAEIGDIARFGSAEKLCGYTGLCPRVNLSGDKDRRGPLTKQGPK